MNYGTDLNLKSSTIGRKMNKGAPRMGAAKGQGAGMGGYNASAVNKAMDSVKGGGGKPTYYCGASKMSK